jgi:hypothetical protein
MTLRDVWLLPQPVRTAPTAITGFVLFTIVSLHPSSEKLAPAEFTMALIDISHITVCEHTVIDLQFTDQARQITLGIDGNAVGIKLASQFGRVLSAVNIRNLGSSERNDIVKFIIAEAGIEIVKIPARGSNDDNIPF